LYTATVKVLNGVKRIVYLYSKGTKWRQKDSTLLK
jgi:hypothetical protein